MSTPNPLIPQGSLEARQFQRRSTTKIVISSILGVHAVVLGGLLFLACNPEPETELADNQVNPPAFAEPAREPVVSDPFGDLPIDTNEIVIPPMQINTNDPFASIPQGGFPSLTQSNLNAGFPSDSGGPTGMPTQTVARGTPPSNTPSRFGPESIPTDRGLLVREPEPPAQPLKYTVVPNDTFWDIADKHGVTVADIARVNPGVDSRKLQVGQVLNLPAEVTPLAPRVPDEGPESAAASETIHEVVSGDTLWGLARRYGTTDSEIRRANGLRGDVIRVGQKLVIPTAAAGDAAP